MKRAVALFLLISGLFAITEAGDITMRQKRALYIPLHENSTLAYWDSVRAIIRDSTGAAIDTVTLDTLGAGRYGGNWIPTSTGNFTEEYNCFWSGGVMCQEKNFTVLDTAAFHGSAAGLTAQEVADTLENRGCGIGICGVGSEEITIKVYEADADSEVCENCEVKFYLVDDADFSDRRRIANSGTNGYISVLSVDPDSYMVTITQPDWNFDVETVLVQDLDQLQVFYLTGTKAVRSDTTVNLYGYVRDAGWNFVEGALVTVKLDMREPIIPTISGSSDIVVTSMIDTTDAAGKWQVAIVPNEYISPTGTRYKVTYEKENDILICPERIIIVPWSETDININSL